jgi:hypothetical protein
MHPKRTAITIIVAATLLGATTAALAQSTTLTDQQRKTIYGTLIKDKNSLSATPGFNASPGSELPSSVLLTPFPKAITDEKVQQFQFAVTGRQVVVADPKTRRIISVIGE